MTQLLITIDNPKDASLIRRLLAIFEGEIISKPKASLDIDDYRPNATTIRTMQDARSSKTFWTDSAARLISEIFE